MANVIANVIIDTKNRPEDKANRIVPQDLKFGDDKTLIQNDKISGTDPKTEILRYIKIVFPDNGGVAYSELSPGIEKPKDKDGFRYEYCSRFDALKHKFIMVNGYSAWVQFINTIRGRKRAEKFIELETIRNNSKPIIDKLNKL